MGKIILHSHSVLLLTLLALAGSALLGVQAFAAQTSKTDMLFQRFDTNSNGTLERDEIPEHLDKLHKSFGVIDANGDG